MRKNGSDEAADFFIAATVEKVETILGDRPARRVSKKLRGGDARTSLNTNRPVKRGRKEITHANLAATAGSEGAEDGAR